MGNVQSKSSHEKTQTEEQSAFWPVLQQNISVWKDKVRLKGRQSRVNDAGLRSATERQVFQGGSCPGPGEGSPRIISFNLPEEYV